MKGSGLFSGLSIVLLLSLLLSSSAWPWPESSRERVGALIVGRQEERPAETTTAEESADESAASSTAAESASGTEASASASASASGSKESESKSGTKTTSTETTPIDPRMPPGGIQLITPAAIDGVQYYKVGDFVTFKWNYTSLSVTPSAIDVLASCSINSATYTIASNMSVEETGAITWDTGEFQATATNPFPVASYTLIVHDSSKDITDIPQAGYLGAYAQYVFGMYTGYV